jgi:hypothetical protein
MEIFFESRVLYLGGLSHCEGGDADGAGGSDGNSVEGGMEDNYTGNIEARRSEYEYDRKLLQPVQG